MAVELQGSTARKGTVSSARSSILCCTLLIPQGKNSCWAEELPTVAPYSLLGDRKVTGGQWKSWNMKETDGLLTCSQSVVSSQVVHFLLALKLLLF